jgi:predicted membrane protein
MYTIILAILGSALLLTIGVSVASYAIMDLLGKSPKVIWDNKYSWFTDIVSIIIGTAITAASFIYWQQY